MSLAPGILLLEGFLASGLAGVLGSTSMSTKSWVIKPCSTRGWGLGGSWSHVTQATAASTAWVLLKPRGVATVRCAALPLVPGCASPATPPLVPGCASPARLPLDPLVPGCASATWGAMPPAGIDLLQRNLVGALLLSTGHEPKNWLI